MAFTICCIASVRTSGDFSEINERDALLETILPMGKFSSFKISLFVVTTFVTIGSDSLYPKCPPRSFAAGLRHYPMSRPAALRLGSRYPECPPRSFAAGLRHYPMSRPAALRPGSRYPECPPRSFAAGLRHYPMSRPAALRPGSDVSMGWKPPLRLCCQLANFRLSEFHFLLVLWRPSSNR